MDDTTILLAFGIICVVLGLILKSFLANPKAAPSSQPNPEILAGNKKTEKKEEIKPKIDYICQILIFFGSQSGTAAKYANILAEEAEKNSFEAKVIDLEEFESYNLKQNICFFVMATYGEGDPTDNAKMFYKWLKSEALSPETLKGLRFSVFGLGNTQYQHYNAMGRNVNKLLENLGGERIYKYGEGDDNSSLEDDFGAWKENIWVRAAAFRLVETSENELDFSEKIEKNSLAGQEFEYQTKKFLDSSAVPVSLIQEVRQNNIDGSTLHIEIDLSSSTFKYRTAQNLGIFPQNTPETVSELAKMLDLNLEKVLKIENVASDSKSSRKTKFPFPSPISVRSILTRFCDFQGPIMKKTLKELAQMEIPPELKSKFEFLASPEGKLDFKKEIEEQKSSLFSLIMQYKLKISLEELIALTPRIAPRLFTISSSNLKFPNKLHVTASLVTDVLPSGATKKGLISSYFSFIKDTLNCEKPPKVMVFFNESNFCLPPDSKTPIIMVGPGTGVAPFRAFLQEKEILASEGKIEKNDMKMALYSGCRHQDGDYIYREEFKEKVEQGLLENYYMAFSRDQGEKVYVQSLIKKNRAEIFETLKNQNGRLYICGSTSMGKEVCEVLEEMFIEFENKGKEEAKECLSKMESDKILIKELWG